MRTLQRKTGIEDHWFFGPALKQKTLYTQIIVASVCINLFALASAFFVMTVYDRVIPNEAMESLLVLTVGVLVVIAFDFVMKMLRGLFIDKAGLAIDDEVAETIFRHVCRNEKLIATQPAGAVAATIKEFDLLKDFLASATLVALVDLPFVLLFLFVLYGLGGWIAAVPGFIVLAVIGVGLLIQPMIRRLSQNSQIDGQNKQSVLVEVLHGLETLKSLRGINLFEDRWMRSVKHQGEALAKSRFWSQITGNFAQTGQQLSQVGIVVYGVYLITSAELTMGSLIACVILSGRTLSPLGQISGLLGRYHQATASYRSLSELLGETSNEATRLNFLRHESVQGRVELANIEFGYPKAKAATLQGFSLVIEPGQHVAIVGKIGSGKSTILKIIAGLIQPQKGLVQIDSVDLSHLHPDDIREHLGVVHQQSILFSGTVKENLLLGAPDATDQDILKICEMTGVDKIAAGLPNGYDTVLVERGQQLSGGQRQAISIARMMLGDPRIVLMDEPTSAMDHQSEQELLEALKFWLKGRTAILVTHRGTIMSLVNRVLAVESGRIVADGPPDQLFKAREKVSS